MPAYPARGFPSSGLSVAFRLRVSDRASYCVWMVRTSDALCDGSWSMSSAECTHLTGCIPDKPTQLARNGHADLVQMELAQTQPPKPMCETQLGVPGDLAHGFGLTFLTYLHEPTQARREAVVPRGLDEHAPRVSVARLGDGAASA